MLIDLIPTAGSAGTDENAAARPFGVGDLAPDFTLSNQDSQSVSLSQFIGKKNVVLFFYPMDYSPICTLEAIAFREAYWEFVSLGAEVIGISNNRPESHASFCNRLKLPFDLLTDEGHRVRDRYGVNAKLGRRAPRVTYVIDRTGMIRGVYAASFFAAAHVRTALLALTHVAPRSDGIGIGHAEGT